MITVERAPAFLVVQDAGREGKRAHGVPVGGAMDRVSLFVGNSLVGNDPRAAALEWSLTGGALRFEIECDIALCGAEADANVDGSPVPRGRAITIRAGQVLEVHRITRGRFLYVAVSGGLDVPEILGGRGTYLPAAFGGLEGRRLRTSDALAIGPRAFPWRERVVPAALDTLAAEPIRIVRGPDAAIIDGPEWELFFASPFTVAPEGDRTGYRLRCDGQIPPVAAGARSTPSCVGAVQLTPAGEAIVLMADAPTIGGYAKIAVVISADVPRLAQRAPGEPVRFDVVSLDAAVERLAEQRAALAALQA